MTAPGTSSDPSTDKPRPSFRLCLILFPFAFGGVAINVYFASLLLWALGVPVISPYMALLLTIPLSIPATWVSARWISSLIAEAEKTPGKT